MWIEKPCPDPPSENDLLRIRLEEAEPAIEQVRILELKLDIAMSALRHLANDLHFPSAMNALRKIQEVEQ